MSDQDMHYGKPVTWLMIDGVWYERINGGFIQPVYQKSEHLAVEDRVELPPLQVHDQIDINDIVNFRKALCRKVISDYEPDRAPDEKETVDSFVAVGNCPAMIDDYRFFPYTPESKEESECLAIFDMFASLENPVNFLRTLAYGQVIVVTVNVVPDNIWARKNEWKRGNNILKYWIHYKPGVYQTYFNKSGFEKLLEDNGFRLIVSMDDEATGMGGKEPDPERDIRRSWDKRIDAWTFAAIKESDNDEHYSD